MQIPFEQDIPADPNVPAEPPVADQAATEADAAPSVTSPTTPNADTGAAQRRITMQLYSRMVTDLKVLTGDKRLPTDAEIDDALNRAVRALGLTLPQRRDAASTGAALNKMGPDEMAPASVAAISPIGSGLGLRRSPFDSRAAMPDMLARFPADASGTVKSFVAGDGLAIAGQAASAPAGVSADGPTPAVAPPNKPDEANAAKEAKPVYPSRLAVKIPVAEFQKTGAARWVTLEGPRLSKEQKAAIKAEKKRREKAYDDQKDAYDQEEKKAKREGRPLPPKPVKPAPVVKDAKSFREGDLDEVLRRELAKPKSPTYDSPDPRVAAFVLSIAGATANAKVHGNQNVEKTLIVGPDASGALVVKWMSVVGEAGGTMPPDEPGDTVIHVHYGDRKQPPHEGDFSAARKGRVSYVIGRDGRNVWEVRREGEAVKVGLITAKGYGPFEDFQIKPKDYKYYNTDRYP